MGDQEDSAGSAGAKLGGGEPPFPETNCKRRLGRSLPGQKPGLRKVAEIRKRNTEEMGEESHLTLLHAKKGLILWPSTATVACAPALEACWGWKRRSRFP